MVARFPGTLESLGSIAAFMTDVTARARLDRHAAYRLRLAVDEVATNIIQHGYAEAGRTGTIDVSARIDAGSLTIEIEDTGEPYDPSAQRLPTAEDLVVPLEQRAPGGLGLFLVLQSVDAFRHENLGSKNRTTLSLRIDIDPGARRHGDPTCSSKAKRIS